MVGASYRTAREPAANSVENERERAAFLDSLCGEDRELRERVERVLRQTGGQTLPAPTPAAITGTPSAPARAGQIVNSYFVLRRVGSGGMSVVYEALDIRIGRRVALKFLPAELGLDEHARTALVNEAKTAAALVHPNIEAVYGVEETPGGQLFIVMAYYDGESLAEKMRRGPVPVSEAASIALQVANGLTGAHEHDVVRRDIKPSNILVTRQNAAKIVDFGIARVIHSAESTRSMSVAGTAPYMSPEQARGQRLDARTDLWSLGAVLYEMVTGRQPFRGNDVPAKLFAVVNDAPAEMSAAIPAGIQAIIYRALAKDPAHRYQTAAELADDLRRFTLAEADGQQQGRRLEAIKKRAQPLRNRSKWFRPGALLPLSATGALAIVLSMLWPVPPKPAAYESYLQAQAYMQRYEKPENLDTAITLLSGSVKADPGFALAYAALGQAQCQKSWLTGDQNLLTAAHSNAKRALELNPNLPRVHVVMGMVQRYLGNLELALAEFQRSLELDPLNADALAGVAGVYQAQQRSADAEATYRRAVAIHPRMWDTHNNLGVFLRNQKRYAEASNEFERAIEITPENVAAYLNLAAVFIDTGRLGDAEKLLSKALEYRPSSYIAAAVYTNLGAVYSRQQRFKQAEVATRRALEHNPGDWITWRNLAQFLRWLGDNDGAVAAYRRALQLLEDALKASPQDAALQAESAAIYAYCGDRPKAESRIETARVLAPDDYKVLLCGANTYAALGDRDRAVALANEAVQKGLTLAELNDEPEARRFRGDPRFRAPTN